MISALSYHHLNLVKKPGACRDGFFHPALEGLGGVGLNTPFSCTEMYCIVIAQKLSYLKIFLGEDHKIPHVLISVSQPEIRIMLQDIVSVVIITGGIAVNQELSILGFLKHLAIIASSGQDNCSVVHIKKSFDKRISLLTADDGRAHGTVKNEIQKGFVLKKIIKASVDLYVCVQINSAVFIYSLKSVIIPNKAKLFVPEGVPYEIILIKAAVGFIPAHDGIALKLFPGIKAFSKVLRQRLSSEPAVVDYLRYSVALPGLNCL